jgi:hypothetical protein
MTGLKRRMGVYRKNVALESKNGQAFHLTSPFFCVIIQKMNVIFRAPSENIPRRRPKHATIPSRVLFAAQIVVREAVFF